MNKKAAAQEDWSGQIFANNWKIIQKYNCAQSKELGLGGKNAHYKVVNQNCGIETYMERTTIGDAIKDMRLIMSKCKGCNDCSKLKSNNCYYATKVRIKPLYKIPDRNLKIEVGKIYGNFIVLSTKPAKQYADNQCRAIIKCRWCGTEQERRFDAILNCAVACDCFRKHSSGEKIVQEWLNQHNIKNKSEYIFKNLYGIKGGFLRYDFAILGNEDQPVKLIEVDGDQHFEEAGSFYNPNGVVQIHDVIKNNFARKHNIPLLRITYNQLLDLDNLILNFLKI